jgi:thioredoxin reductase (NADPH)
MIYRELASAGGSGPLIRIAGSSHFRGVGWTLMALPVLVAVDEDPDVLENVETQLGQRYGRDYRVESVRDPDEALRKLTELRDSGADVALVLAGHSVSGTTGGELLEHVRRLHPHAKRALLVSANAWTDEPTAEAIRASMALGRADH